MIEKDTLSLYFVERNDIQEDEIQCGVHIPFSHIFFTETERENHKKKTTERREKRQNVRKEGGEDGKSENESEKVKESEKEKEKEKEKESLDEKKEKVREENQRREREREERQERYWKTKEESEGEVIHERGVYVWIQVAANIRVQLKVFDNFFF